MQLASSRLGLLLGAWQAFAYDHFSAIIEGQDHAATVFGLYNVSQMIGKSMDKTVSVSHR